MAYDEVGQRDTVNAFVRTRTIEYRRIFYRFEGLGTRIAKGWEGTWAERRGVNKGGKRRNLIKEKIEGFQVHVYNPKK